MANTATKRIRTCIGCGAQADKRELMRIVRTPDAGVRFDATGNAAGRGAYVCSSECFDKAASKGKVARALKCGIGREETALVAEELANAHVGTGAR